MSRRAPAVLAVLAAVLHSHHHIRGPGIGYVAIGGAALAGWIGVPGLGEATLIAAGVLAVHHNSTSPPSWPWPRPGRRPEA